MRGRGRFGEAGRLSAVAALLALLLQLAVPPGVMVSKTSRALVICTGHGPLELHAKAPARPGKSPVSAPSGVCAFAGHAAQAVGPTPALATPAAARYEPPPAAAFTDLAPGRGLAAPPPPSQGPPSLLA